jgi:hypothetical protein
LWGPASGLSSDPEIHRREPEECRKPFPTLEHFCFPCISLDQGKVGMKSEWSLLDYG